MYKFINIKTLHSYLDEENHDLIRHLIGLILDINLFELEELTEYYRSDDFENIKKRCHKTKPSLSYIGAFATLELVEEIEQNPIESKPINDLLQYNIKMIREELDHYIKNLRSKKL